jgi:Ubiquitin carboxyl-terminal hydrolase
VLHFSLLRFVYAISTMERKKSKHTMSFPTSLDMSRFLGSGSKGGSSARKRSHNMYELRGVLLHKGSSAYHGHYEAQVFDVMYEFLQVLFSSELTRA